MRYEIGTILRDSKGQNWCIVKRTPYEASAHNDRWTDYITEFLKVSKTGRITKQHLRSTTDDLLWGFDIVGKADVTFTVNIDKITLEK